MNCPYDISTMATPAEHDLVLAEAESNKEKSQVFGILRFQEEKSAGEKASTTTTMRAGDGRWQAPIFALARKASETFSGSSSHVLAKVAEPTSFVNEWSAQGNLELCAHLVLLLDFA